MLSEIYLISVLSKNKQEMHLCVVFIKKTFENHEMHNLHNLHLKKRDIILLNYT